MTVQLPEFPIDSSWEMPTHFPEWPEHGRVSLDTETHDPGIQQKLGIGVRRGGYIAGVSLAIEGGPAMYLPINHGTGPNLDPDKVFEYLRQQAKVFKGEFVGMNLPYDLDYLAEAGVVFRNAVFRDVGIAAVLIDERHRRYSLNHILTRAGLAPKDEGELYEAAARFGLDPKADMWKLPASAIARYAIADATRPLDLLRQQEAELESQNLREIWELESSVLPLAVKLRRRGIKINLDSLDKISSWALEQQQGYLDRIKHVTGVTIEAQHMDKKGPIAEALLAIGYRLPKTATGQPKTDEKTLNAIKHDVGKWIVRAKKFNKMRTTFAASMRKHEINGRIHATWKQLKGEDDTGSDEKGTPWRWSCVEPNMTQQYSPEKEPEISAKWRTIFEPEDGCLWCAADYSAQEPRWIAQYAMMAEAQGGADLVRAYQENPRLDLHQRTADICGIERKPAKIIFLGKAYGMGGAKLCNSLGLPTQFWEPEPGKKIEVAGEEGRALIQKYDDMVPFMVELSDMASNRANAVGYVLTHDGRRCRFDKRKTPLRVKRKGKWKTEYYHGLHKALNKVIQGSSAGQLKKAMVAADREGFYINGCFHDELGASVETRARGEELGEIMANVVQVDVPFIVDVELGDTWGTAQ